MTITDLPDEIVGTYVLLRELPDGRILGARQLMFHWTMHVGIDAIGYEERYCYERLDQVLLSMAEWTGEGDPPGDWHKHPPSGRRRDPKTGEIWHERDDWKRARKLEIAK